MQLDYNPWCWDCLSIIAINNPQSNDDGYYHNNPVSDEWFNLINFNNF